MANYSTNLKSWGATGQEYPNGYSQAEGEEPVAEWHNFLFNNLISDSQHLISLTNTLDNDVADLKNGNISVGSADEADKVDGWDKADIQTWVNNNADVPNADQADSATSADDADTVDGWHKADIKSWVNNNADVPDADYADNAGQLEGNTYSDVQTWVNNNADVPDADYADNAGDADKVDGKDWADIETYINNQTSNYELKAHQKSLTHDGSNNPTSAFMAVNPNKLVSVNVYGLQDGDAIPAVEVPSVDHINGQDVCGYNWTFFDTNQISFNLFYNGSGSCDYIVKAYEEP